MRSDRRQPGPGLLADIGGTNARFALADDTGFGVFATLPTRDFDGPADAIRAYLRGHAGDVSPRAAAIGWAGPIDGRRARLTNTDWAIDADALADELGLAEVVLVNDFAAVAWAVPSLAAADLFAVGGGAAVAGAPAAVLGAGTGLGMAGYVPHDGGAMVVVGEGGHATLPATTDREAALVADLRREYGHVSAERLLCGDGLVRLYDWCNRTAATPSPARTAAEITAAAVDGSCPVSRQALDLFCEMFGTVAGDLALTLGALGGVYIAGGIIPHFSAYFASSGFRRRFQAKGRFEVYLAQIPTWVVQHPAPAFIGLAHLLRTAVPRSTSLQ